MKLLLGNEKKWVCIQVASKCQDLGMHFSYLCWYVQNESETSQLLSNLELFAYFEFELKSIFSFDI